MKKIYALVLCVLLIMVPLQIFGADKNIKLSAGRIKATSEETVDVPITIENNTGICGATVYVTYDTKLKLKSVQAGTALTGLTMTKPGKFEANPIKILWDGTDADSSNGEIAILTFDKPASDGIYSVAVSYVRGDIIDGDLKAVEPELSNGYIQVGSGSQENSSSSSTRVTGSSSSAKDENGSSSEKKTDSSSSEAEESEHPTSGSCGESAKWSLEDGVLTISGTGKMYDYNLVDPVPWEYYSLDDIKKIVVSDGITEIGDYCFAFMYKAEEFVLPDSIQRIGDYSLCYSELIEDLSLPTDLKTLGEGALSGSEGLVEVTIPAGLESIGDSCFFACDALKKINYGGDETGWNKLMNDSENQEALLGVEIEYNYRKDDSSSSVKENNSSSSVKGIESSSSEKKDDVSSSAEKSEGSSSDKSSGSSSSKTAVSTNEIKQKAEKAISEQRGDVNDTVSLTQTGKKLTLGKIANVSANEARVTVVKGCKFIIPDMVKKSAATLSAAVKVSSKGVVTAKRDTAGEAAVITYMNAGSNMEQKLMVVVKEPAVKANSDGIACSKLTINALTGAKIDAKVNVPLGATVLNTKNKKNAVTDLKMDLGDDGEYHVTGMAAAKGNASVIFMVNGRKYTVKIKVK